MTSIFTLTLNPSVDVSSEAEFIRPIRKIRTFAERHDPGGGGINAARVVRELGGAATALYMGGGATGRVLDELLEREAVEARRIDIAEDTRIAQVVFERASGLEYRFTPEGPAATAAELRSCLDALETLKCDWLIVSGSLPRGAPPEFYARIAERAWCGCFKVALDTSGAALRGALDGGGFHLVKPSLGELEALVGRELPSLSDRISASRELVEAGSTEIVALTMGREGAVLVTKDVALRLESPRVLVRSAVGAGDAFLAAMVLALTQGRRTEEAFAYGVAAGAAATLTAGTELCRREDVERLRVETERALAEAQAGGRRPDPEAAPAVSAGRSAGPAA